MKAPLKNSIQEKFSQIELSDDKLDKLMALQTKHLNTQEDESAVTSYEPLIKPSILAFAAMILLTFSVFIFQPYQQTNMAVEIANEVTHNHFKLKPLEVESSVLSEVNSYFTKLDFEPISSHLLATQKMTLLGARYCSLQGITAAQIRYKSEDGKVTTFYEVPYNKDIYSDMPIIEKGDEPIVSYSKGMGVKIWVEKGILMAMTL